MIVLDASVALEVLLNTAVGEAAADRILAPEEDCAAPQLLDVEILQVLRRYEAAGSLGSSRAREAVEDLRALPVVRYPHGPLLERAWMLRKIFTAYDAVYVALAEALDAPLLTRDGRVAGAPGHRARIELI